MADARQPVPSPVLGIVGLVVVAGLIALVIKWQVPSQQGTQPPGADTTQTESPEGGTETSERGAMNEPAARRPDAAPTSTPAQTPPSPPSPPSTPSMPTAAQLAEMDAGAMATALATVPAGDRMEISTQALLMAAAREDASAEVVTTLQSAGAKVNATDARGRTPLMLAAAAGNVDMVFALLDVGASAWTKDAEGMDAREHALARNDKAGYDVAAVLEEAGPQ